MQAKIICVLLFSIHLRTFQFMLLDYPHFFLMPVQGIFNNPAILHLICFKHARIDLFNSHLLLLGIFFQSINLLGIFLMLWLHLEFRHLDYPVCENLHWRISQPNSTWRFLREKFCRSPEEALVHAVIEARRSSPSILYLPHLNLWWETAPSSLRATLWMLLADLPPDLPLLFLSTSDSPISEIPEEALALFGNDSKTFVYELQAPTKEERENMFRPICTELAGAPQKKPSLMNLGPPPQVIKSVEDLQEKQILSPKMHTCS